MKKQIEQSANLNVGAKIRYARRLKGIKQKDLARKLNVSANYICMLEKGKTKPSLETIINIASIVGVSVASLIENNPVLDILKKLSAEHKIAEIEEGLQIIKDCDKSLSD